MPVLQKKYREYKAKRDVIVVPNESLMKKRFKANQKLNDTQVKLREIVNKPKHLLQFLVPGRLVHIINGDVDWGWGVLVNYRKVMLADNKKSKSRRYGVDYFAFDMTSMIRITHAWSVCSAGTAVWPPQLTSSMYC